FGVKSQSVVLITGAFTGMVLAAQTFLQFHKVKMDTATLAVVSVSMCSELGPVLTGLMVGGRVGAAFAAGIGTMRVTETIDALRRRGRRCGASHHRSGGLFFDYHSDYEFFSYVGPQPVILEGMIEARDLSKSFGPLPVLERVSLRIEKGESVVIIGRSGGGKSVLLKLLIGLLDPDAGQVLIEGENIVPMNELQLLRVRRRFGMLFQSAALFDSMTVAENVAFA